MFRKKVYGEYKEEKCPFCSKMATAKNRQGVPVCLAHKDELLENMRCICGELLDIRDGKYGIYFQCLNCGPQSPSKIFSLNNPGDETLPYKVNTKKGSTTKSPSNAKKSQSRKNPRPVQEIYPDDPRYF